jgi:hypothetical protein
MGRSFFLSFISLLSLISAARAEVLEIRQNLADRNGKVFAEVSTFVTEDESDRQIVIARLQKSLAQDRATNPALQKHFEWVKSEHGRAPSAAKPIQDSFDRVDSTEPVKKRILSVATSRALRQHSGAFFAKNHRIVFTLIRGGLNSGISYWGFAASDEVPLEVALVAGAMTGMMSASMQYWNDDILKYLTNSHLQKWFPQKNHFMKAATGGESLVRWYILEVGFVSVIEAVLASFGHPSHPSFATTFGTTAFTALLAVGAQGFWDVGNAKWSDAAMAKAATHRLQNSIRLRSGFLSLGISALSVGMAISRILGLDVSYWIAGGMAVTGGIFLAKVSMPRKSCLGKFQTELPPTSSEAPATDLNAPIP